MYCGPLSATTIVGMPFEKCDFSVFMMLEVVVEVIRSTSQKLLVQSTKTWEYTIVLRPNVYW